MGCCGVLGATGVPTSIPLRNPSNARVFAAAPCSFRCVVPETDIFANRKGPPAYISSEFTNLQLVRWLPSSDWGAFVTRPPFTVPSGSGGRLGIELANPGPHIALGGSRSCGAASTAVVPRIAQCASLNRSSEQRKPNTNDTMPTVAVLDDGVPFQSLHGIVVCFITRFTWRESVRSFSVSGDKVITEGSPVFSAKNTDIIL